MLPDGRQVEVDFKAQTVTFSEVTVETITTDDRVEVEISGSPAKVEKVLKDFRRKYGDQIPTLSEYPEDKIVRETIEQPEILTRLSIRPETVMAAGVNIALGAGVLAAGESFASSELAAALRDRRDAPPGGVVDMAKPEALEVLDEQYAAMSAGMVASGFPDRDLPTLNVKGSVNDVVFIPYDNKTMVFVRLLGLQLFGQGIVLDAPMPAVGAYGPPVAPVLVRETAAELIVVDFTERLIPEG
ncbi:MAG: hypothetical protein Q8K58_09105 [Acidimicrobiales bacterium]|nr:hypothetical protein [Acidimicrobiales bacterium]